MVKYVNYGHPREGIRMYVITMFRTPHGSYKVEVLPCDANGYAVSDPVAWDIFPDWISARIYVHKKYKEFYKYLNSGR